MPPIIAEPGITVKYNDVRRMIVRPRWGSGKNTTGPAHRTDPAMRFSLERKFASSVNARLCSMKAKRLAQAAGLPQPELIQAVAKALGPF